MARIEKAPRRKEIYENQTEKKTNYCLLCAHWKSKAKKNCI